MLVHQKLQVAAVSDRGVKAPTCSSFQKLDGNLFPCMGVQRQHDHAKCALIEILQLPIPRISLQQVPALPMVCHFWLLAY